MRSQTLSCALIMAAAALVGGPGACSAPIELASGTMGATGQIGGVSVTRAQFVGWRFEIAAPLRVDRIGGHLLGDLAPGGVFAALVALESIDAFPLGAPFTPEEVIATTTFKPPFPSQEVFTPLATTLSPGSYALAFGSDLFGAAGEAAIVNSQDQNDVPPTTISSFIFWGIPSPGELPVWRTNLASHMRVVIEGRAIGPGDFDEDGEVDGEDLTLWTAGFGAAGAATPTQGDADGDQDVDGDDFLVWQRELGAGDVVAVPAAVPEPSSGMLPLSALVVALLPARSRRRSR